MSDMHAVGICGSFALNEIRWPTPNTSIAASSVDRAPTRPARLSSPSSVARIHSRSLSPTSADFRANSLTSIRPLATRVPSESRHAPRAIEYATDTASPCHWARNVAATLHEVWTLQNAAGLKSQGPPQNSGDCDVIALNAIMIEEGNNSVGYERAFGE